MPPGDRPIDVDEATFDAIVGTNGVPILVDFWALWCVPCHTASPEVARTAREMAGLALVLKVDVERERNLSARFGVRGIPSFVVLNHGRVVIQQAGVVDSRQLVAWLMRAGGEAPRAGANA